MPAITRHQALATPLPADVAEWCPHPEALSVLAVGSYKLDEASQSRLGRLHMYAVSQEGGAAAAGGGDAAPAAAGGSDGALAQTAAGPRLEPLTTLDDLPGVFDLRWHPRSAMPQLAAALADGSVRLLTFAAELAAGGAAAEPCSIVTLIPGEEPAEGMAVSLDYSRAGAAPGEQLAVSYSSGQLQLFQAGPAGLQSVATWQAHDLEAWVAATDHWHPSLLHSGGDDAAYRLWDSRQGYDTPAWQDRRTHGAGVCIAASSPHQEHVAVTGSYDDRLRLWDLRSLARPLMQAEADMGGGVWRAKWHPTEPQLLLAACMYNGFAVVRAAAAGAAAGAAGAQEQQAAAAIETLQTYEHAPGSLSYGADWCRRGAAAGGSSGGSSLAATASFYDCQVHLWSYTH